MCKGYRISQNLENDVRELVTYKTTGKWGSDWVGQVIN